MSDKELKHNICLAAKRWFYEAFEDDLLENMQEAGLIAQAEGFSLSCIGELQAHIESAVEESRPSSWISVSERLPEDGDQVDVYGYRYDWVEHGFTTRESALTRSLDVYFENGDFGTDLVVEYWQPPTKPE